MYGFNSEIEDLQSNCLAGKMQELVIGSEYIVSATYKFDKKYGAQYVPQTIYPIVPKDFNTQLMFLKSLIPELTAHSLLEAYPTIVDDVVNNHIDVIDYSSVKGVQELTWMKIKEKILNNYVISDIIILLKPLGITFTMIKKLLKDEPNAVLLKEKILKNPYLLTKVHGLGFKKVDDLALKLKPNLLCSHERVIAFTNYYLSELGESDGHTWVSKDVLLSAISNTIPECHDLIDWLLGNNNFLHICNDKIGLKHYYDIECKVLDIIKSKCELKPHVTFTDYQISKAIRVAEEEQGFTYTDEQVSKIKTTLTQNVGFVIGEAGTGKTSIMRAILKAFTLYGYTITSSALSAMAAQRIEEATNVPAKTIHRTLGCTGFNDFMFNKDNCLITDVALLDEASMVNAHLFLKWLEAIGDRTMIIISGDNKQLPPIGYGNVFSDLINCLGDEVVNALTEPMRQAKNSGILTDAKIIRSNKNPITNNERTNKIVHGQLQDMYYMFRSNRQTLFDIAIKTFLKSVETDGIDNVAIAVPRRSDCLNSVFELNREIQDRLLPDVDEKIVCGNMEFKLGAKVMQTVNDYDKNIFNGEIGYITKIDEKHNGKTKVEYCEVSYPSFEEKGITRIVEYPKNEMSQLDLAYAMTVHKLQGAGRKTVIGIIDNTHFKLLDNCLAYTMLTRAKKRFLLLAEYEAFLQCIRTSHNKRNTWLSLSERIS